jgi:hypothetical protein
MMMIAACGSNFFVVHIPAITSISLSNCDEQTGK